MRVIGAVLSTAVVGFSQITLQELEVSAKREVLTPFEIRESFAKDPAEALSKVEGVWKLRKGTIANDIVIRGFKGKDLTVLFDGARIYAACPNRMDPPAFHVDFAEVQEIEVVKGAFDVRNYGSLGGTVNIKTKKPKRGLSVDTNLSVGSFSYLNPSLNISYSEDRFYILAGYSYRYSKPYESGEGKKLTEYANYKPSEINSTAFRINTFWTKAGFRLSPRSEVSFSYTAQRARDVIYPYLMMDSPKDDADRFTLNFRHGALDIKAYYSKVNHLMNNSRRRSPMFMETRAKTNTTGIKAQLKLSREFLLGLEAFRWNWKAKTLMMGKMQNTIPDADLKNLGIFGEYRKALLPKLRLIAGVRLDLSRTEADKNLANLKLYRIYHDTTSTSKSDTYPSGNIQLRYEFRKGLEAFLGLGYSVRVPDAQERYFALNRMGNVEKKLGDWVGNPNLKPAKNTEIDIGFKLRSKSLSGEVSFFYSYVKDFITLYNQKAVNPLSSPMESNSYARSYTNVDAIIFGTEARMNYAITDALFLTAGLSYVRGRKDKKPELGITDKDIAEIPPLRVRTALRYDNGRFFGEIETVASATQSKVDSDLNETETSGYGVVNLKVGGEYKGFRIVAGVENLLDKLYYEHLSYLRDPFSSGVKLPEPGRSFYLNVSYSF